MKEVVTYGTYDLLHQGHINLLRRAKELGDYLIVGVTNDNFDRERGKLNVCNNVLERVEAVKSTGLADQIIIEEYFGQKIDDIQKYDVDIFAIGSDWEGKFDYLNEYCKVVYLILPIHALSLVQMTKLQKEIKFKKNFFISFISSLLSAVIAIYIAYLYKSVWALVLQVMMTSAIRCVLLWATSDFIPVLRFSKESYNKYFKFSKNLLLSGFIGTLFNNIYPLIIGKAYSASELGYYSQSKKINDLASQTTTQVVQSVTYPILAQINNEGGDIKDGYKKIISATLIIVGFVMAMILGCAQDFFEICMGDPVWRTAGTYLILIGISGVLYPLHAINQNILLVKGESKNILKLEIIRRSVMIAILLVTINFNIEVFVFGLSFYSFVLLFLNLYYCGKPINYTVLEQLKDTMPIFIRLIIMVILANITAHLLPSLHIIARIALSSTICITSGLLLFWKQQNFRELIRLVKSMINK